MHPSEDMLHAFLDEALDLSTYRTVETHLRSCAACRARVRQIRMVFLALENLPAEAPSRDLAASVLDSLPPASGIPLLPVFVQALFSLGALAWGWARLRPAMPSIDRLYIVWMRWMAGRPWHRVFPGLPHVAPQGDASLVWILLMLVLLLGVTGNALLLRPSSRS